MKTQLIKRRRQDIPPKGDSDSSSDNELEEVAAHETPRLPPKGRVRTPVGFTQRQMEESEIIDVEPPGPSRMPGGAEAAAQRQVKIESDSTCEESDSPRTENSGTVATKSVARPGTEQRTQHCIVFVSPDVVMIRGEETPTSSPTRPAFSSTEPTVNDERASKERAVAHGSPSIIDDSWIRAMGHFDQLSTDETGQEENPPVEFTNSAGVIS